jgi:hypothetical protein
MIGSQRCYFAFDDAMHTWMSQNFSWHFNPPRLRWNKNYDKASFLDGRGEKSMRQNTLMDDTFTDDTFTDATPHEWRIINSETADFILSTYLPCTMAEEDDEKEEAMLQPPSPATVQCYYVAPLNDPHLSSDDEQKRIVTERNNFYAASKQKK